jgi:hypothetical protein
MASKKPAVATVEFTLSVYDRKDPEGADPVYEQTFSLSLPTEGLDPFVKIQCKCKGIRHYDFEV